jgi:ribosome-binding ATPase YchF (GTP1/OBG family)
MVEIGVVGKPNVGKSTFFNAATHGHAETASYPFTTIDPNAAVAYVRTQCVCTELGVEDNPRNSKCIEGVRFAPVNLIDVAGLVPDAHKGKGLGNKFLDDLRQAAVLVHVVDASGSTDEEGNPVKIGSRDPADDILFLENEIERWFNSIFTRNWDKVARRVETEKKDFSKYFEELFAGIGISEATVHQAIKEAEADPQSPSKWGEEKIFRFSKALRKHSKKMIIAANKTDVSITKESIEKLRARFPDYNIIPTSSMAEYVLVNLLEKGAISYIPGDPSYEVLDESKLGPREKKALEMIEKNVFERFGGTGIQECINKAVFDVLEKVVVYPVEDETHYKDKEGRVLPDVFLMDKESTPLDVAEKIHSDIAKHYVTAIDARTKRKISKDHKLNHCDVIKIISKA